MRNLIIGSLLSALLVASGCAGHRTHDSGQSAQNQPAQPAPVTPPAPPQLGEGQNVPSEQNVVESKEITRTISSEIPTVKSTLYKGDLNRMDQTNFEVLGVPADVSQNIVTYRAQSGGKFQSVEALKAVPGMNDQIFNQLKDKVGVAK